MRDSLHLFHFDTGTPEQVYTVGYTVGIAIDHSLYACLDYEFRTFHTWRCCHIKRRIVAAVAGRMLQPVLPGILYKIRGIFTDLAMVPKC